MGVIILYFVFFFGLGERVEGRGKSRGRCSFFGVGDFFFRVIFFWVLVVVFRFIV